MSFARFFFSMSLMLLLRDVSGSLLKPITYPNLEFSILLLANPIVCCTFTKSLVLILFGLGASILLSVLGVYVLLSPVYNCILNIFALVDDAIYINSFIIGRLTHSSLLLQWKYYYSGTLGQRSSFTLVSMESLLQLSVVQVIVFI